MIQFIEMARSTQPQPSEEGRPHPSHGPPGGGPVGQVWYSALIVT